MFGKRTGSEPALRAPALASAAPAGAAPDSAPAPKLEPVFPAAAPKQVAPVAGKAAPPPPRGGDLSDDYYQIKSTIFNALIDAIDLAQLAQLEPEAAREEI